MNICIYYIYLCNELRIFMGMWVLLPLMSLINVLYTCHVIYLLMIILYTKITIFVWPRVLNENTEYRYVILYRLCTNKGTTKVHF